MPTSLQQYSKIQALVQKEAKDIALAVYSQKATEYGVAQTPAHEHNNTDSLPIPFDSIENSNAYIAFQSITLTPLQIKALNTTPITIVPACGGRSINIVESIDARLVYATATYTGANALEFRYTDATGAKVTTDISTTFLNSATSTYSHVAGVVTELVPVSGAPIVVRIPTANPAVGNSPITFVVKYRVVAYAA